MLSLRKGEDQIGTKLFRIHFAQFEYQGVHGEDFGRVS